MKYHGTHTQHNWSGGCYNQQLSTQEMPNCGAVWKYSCLEVSQTIYPNIGLACFQSGLLLLHNMEVCGADYTCALFKRRVQLLQSVGTQQQSHLPKQNAARRQHSVSWLITSVKVQLIYHFGCLPCSQCAEPSPWKFQERCGMICSSSERKQVLSFRLCHKCAADAQLPQHTFCELHTKRAPQKAIGNERLPGTQVIQLFILEQLLATDKCASSPAKCIQLEKTPLGRD